MAIAESQAPLVEAARDLPIAARGSRSAPAPSGSPQAIELAALALGWPSRPGLSLGDRLAGKWHRASVDVGLCRLRGSSAAARQGDDFEQAFSALPGDRHKVARLEVGCRLGGLAVHLHVPAAACLGGSRASLEHPDVPEPAIEPLRCSVVLQAHQCSSPVGAQAPVE